MPVVSEPEGTQKIAVGRIGALLDGADLRYLTIDGEELVRRLHVAVRDEGWATLEPDTVATGLEREGDGLLLHAECRHESRAAALDWIVEARLAADGEVSYRAAFAFHRPFPYARIGICVLLPPAALIGRRFAATTEAGGIDGTVAAEIAPQWIDGDLIKPMFASFSRLWVRAPAHDLELWFEGDLFEMEDQRNWSDGSFKVYGTPLSRPRPQRAEPDQPIAQQVRLAPPARRTAAAAPAADEVAAIELGPPGELAVPGFGLALEGARVAAAAGPLGDLGLGHIHVALDGENDGARLAEAAALAAEAGAALHVAARLAEPGDAATFAAALAPHAELIAWVLAFDTAGIGSGELAAAVREDLAQGLPRALVAGGTDLAFADLNRTRPASAGMDAVAWAVDPQVHGGDSLSAIEALAPQADQVATAAALAPGLGALVGPIELRPPAALGADGGARFAAAWATASFATLAGAGALAATYRRWQPAALAGAWRGRALLPARSSQPLAVAALGVAGEESGLLLVNLRNQPTRVAVSGPDAAWPEQKELELGPYELASVG